MVLMHPPPCKFSHPAQLQLLAGSAIDVIALNPHQRQVTNVFGRHLQDTGLCPIGLFDGQFGRNAVMRIGCRERVDDRVLDFAVFAIYIHAAPCFGKRMNTVKYLAASAILDFMQFFPEQRQGLPVCGNNLPWISLHQKNRCVDCLKQRAAVRRAGFPADTFFTNSTPQVIWRGAVLPAGVISLPHNLQFTGMLPPC